MSKRKPQSLLEGAFVLSVAAILTKVIGAVFFKIPLEGINFDGFGSFTLAYDYYSPIYLVTTAGLPMATSRMVSQAIYNKRFRDVDEINKVAKRIFFVTGMVGTLIMVILAFIIPNFVDQPLMLTLLIMAPAVLFSGMEGAYRGVYEGSRNMYPTAIAQIIESTVKLIVGLLLAKLVQNYAMAQFANGLPVFGKVAADSVEASQRAIPYVSAAAMLGVTLGALIAIIYLMARYRLKGTGITASEIADSPAPTSRRILAKTLISIAIPVALGAAGTQITNLIDSTVLARMLKSLNDNHGDYLRGVYAEGLNLAKSTDINKFLNATRQAVMTIVGLVPNITMTLGISALPIITAAWEENDKRKIQRNITAVLRIIMLIAIPSGVGLSVLAGPVLKLVYGANSASHISGAAQMQVLGIAVIFLCMLSPIQSILQGMGKAKIAAYIVILGGVVKLVFNLILVPIPALNILGSAYSTLISQFSMAVAGMVALRKVSGVKLPLNHIMLGPAIGGAATGVVAWGSNALLSQLSASRFVPVISILLAVIAYFATLFFIHAIRREDIMMLPKGAKIAAALEKIGWIK